MKPLHITIITFAWPPRNSIGAHRPLSWAKYWSQAGAHVRVLTAKKYSYDEPLDLEIPTLAGVEVIEIDYATSSSSLIAYILSSPLGDLARKIYRTLRSSKAAIRNPRERWLEAVLLRFETLAQETDVVVSTYDPRAVHQIAAEMKKANSNLVWVADYRDLWSLNHVPLWSDEQRVRERAIEEQTVGEYADLVSSISEDLARQQGTFVDKPWLCVTNGFDVDLDVIEAALVASPPPRRKPLNVVYTGKLYQGLRDPSALLETIAEMEDAGEISSGDIAVNIYGGQVDGLGTIMASGRYDHFVHLHGHVSRDIALRAQGEADLLLLLESPLPEARGVLTGKIFEYMATGVPILSLGSSKDSAIGSVLITTKTGLCAEVDHAAIHQTLCYSLAGRKPNWFAPDLAQIAGYSREAQADKLLNHIRSLTEAEGQCP